MSQVRVLVREWVRVLAGDVQLTNAQAMAASNLTELLGKLAERVEALEAINADALANKRAQVEAEKRDPVGTLTHLRAVPKETT